MTLNHHRHVLSVLKNSWWVITPIIHDNVLTYRSFVIQIISFASSTLITYVNETPKRVYLTVFIKIQVIFVS